MNILKKIYYVFTSKGAWILLPTFLIGMFMPITASVQAAEIPNAGFEDGTFTGWDKGAQTGTLGNTITQNGSGVTIFTGSRTFTHGSNPAVGNPSSQYYAPAVASGSWTFSPSGGTKAVLLQPKNQQTFNQAMSALNLSAGSVTEIKSMLTSQAQSSGNGGGTPTDAAWITREVELTAGTTYTMAWNYVGTDYVPFNDGSITSLVPVTVTGTPVVTVNNYVKQYALLGFTNPGTGDYSTNSYGATGWQTSTYEVSISGTYELGFASFNLDDTGLPPALMVDDGVGSTQRCVSGTCNSFGGVAPNNETAPTVAPTTTTTSTTSTTSTTTTTSSTVAPTTTTSTTTTSSTTTSTTTVPVTTTTSTTVYVGNGDTTTTSTSTTSTTSTTTTVYVPPVVVVIPPVDAGPVDSGTTTTTYPSVVILPVDTTLPLVTVTTIPTITIPTTPPAGTSNGNELTPTTLLIPTESTLLQIPPITIAPTEPEKEKEVSPTTTYVKPIAPIDDFKEVPQNASPTAIAEIIEAVDFTKISDKNFNKAIDDVFENLDKPADVVNVLNSFIESKVSNEQFETILNKVFDDISDIKQVTDVVVSLLSSDKPLTNQELNSVMEAVFSEEATVTQMAAVMDNLLDQKLDVKELDAVFEAAFDDDLSDKETIDLIVDVLKEDLTSEALGSALGAVFDDEVSNEVLVETFTAVLGTELNKESVGVIVGVLESDTITNQQVATVVTLIIEQEGGVDSEQATELATSAKVLESVDGAQATEVFGALVVPQISSEDGLAIVNAIEEAPKEVKESFEEEINIFTGVFDTYTSIGSTVDTGSRRTLIAATTAVATIATAVSTGGGSGGSTGGSGGSTGGSGGSTGGSGGGSGGSGGTNTEGRSKKEEEGEEPAGEIAGPGDDEDSNFTKNSIFKYYTKEGIEMRKFDWLGFAKKLWDITAGLAFTFAGSVVVYYTLSGTTQTIALVSTVTACVVHYTHQILKNDED